MGYVVLIVVVILLILFTYKHIRRFLSETKKRNETMEQGYYLVSHTYEEKREQTHYYGVFQQGDKELILEMSPSLFTATATATRDVDRQRRPSPFF